MKRLVLLFAALLVAGCGEKKSPEVNKLPKITSQDLAQARFNRGLLEATGDGSIEEIRKYLTAGADVNTDGGIWGMPLLNAVERGDTEMVELLISNGANLDARISFLGVSPLLKAATQGNKEIVALLISKGAKLETLNGHGETALMVAAKGAHKSIVELLVAKGADLHAKSVSQNNALDLVSIRRQLLEQGLGAEGGESSEDSATIKELTEIEEILRQNGVKGGYRIKLKD